MALMVDNSYPSSKGRTHDNLDKFIHVVKHGSVVTPIVKFVGETPDFLVGETQYSHNEIIEIINNPDNGWIEEQ